MAIPRNKVALEAWLADLHSTLAVSEIGPAFLALQINELENKCVALRKRMHYKAQSNRRAKQRCALRSAA
jgi:hypothetical protein